MGLNSDFLIFYSILLYVTFLLQLGCLIVLLEVYDILVTMALKKNLKINLELMLSTKLSEEGFILELKSDSLTFLV